MRIYTLKGKEKDSFAKALPDDTEDSEALMKCLMNSGFSIVDEKNVSAVSVDSICDKLSPYVEHADTKKIVPLSRIREAMWEEIASTLPEMLLVEELFVPLHELDYYNKDLSIAQATERPYELVGT